MISWDSRTRSEISIHALREEGDGPAHSSNTLPVQFLSTPSARRATPAGWTQPQADGDFYPRPPRGGRPLAVWIAERKEHISIHALREEGDKTALHRGDNSSNFYPRPPRGGRPPDPGKIFPQTRISIHALREEGDARDPQAGQRGQNFYPRPPRGGRRYGTPGLYPRNGFLSTPSARRATRNLISVCKDCHISIHALREEGDSCTPRGRYELSGFLSTPSARRATMLKYCEYYNEKISIHALREEGDELK